MTMNTLRLVPGVLLLLVSLAAAQKESPGADSKIPERSEIDAKYKWDLTDMYPNDDAWEADYAYIESKIPDLAAFEGKISKSGKNLLDYFKASEDVYLKAENAYSYANMSYHQDTREQKYSAMKDRIGSLNARVGTATSWFSPELLSISDADLEKWYKNTPGLDLYRQYIANDRRSKDHTLSADQEKLLAMTSDMAGGFDNASEAFRNADLKFPTVKDDKGKDVELSESRYRALLQSPKQSVRRDAAAGLYNTYVDYKNTAAALMGGDVAAYCFYAKARKYNSALDMATDGDNVDTTVYLNLIETVKKNSEPLRKYVDLRRRALKLKEIHLYDFDAPLVGEPDEWPYDTAVVTIHEALKPLGKEYEDGMMAGFNSGWTDIYENAGKRSGAYSWGSYASHPYMLNNYYNTLDDMFTLAHEMGHCMHTWHTYKNQPFVYGDYAIFVAEVASTANEAFLMDYLLKHEKDPEKRLTYVNMFIDNIRGTIIAQTIFAEYELKQHRMYENGEALSPDALADVYSGILKEYYGNSIAFDDFYGYTWARIPHFYSNFYVYKYATSMSAALALSQRVLNGGEQELQDYLGFLSGGSSKYPLDLLRGAGVDMSSPAPVQSAMDKLAELVDEFEKLLIETGKIKG